MRDARAATADEGAFGLGRARGDPIAASGLRLGDVAPRGSDR